MLLAIEGLLLAPSGSFLFHATCHELLQDGANRQSIYCNTYTQLHRSPICPQSLSPPRQE